MGSNALIALLMIATGVADLMIANGAQGAKFSPLARTVLKVLGMGFIAFGVYLLLGGVLRT